ncbi:acyl carrier protein [Pseudomonas sp. NPDC047963]|jgi:acyl carrier protein|uniref:Acyl carrier protein n=1 Tax=Stutzerimonas stutzeri TaxID=316 RepID=A0A5S5BBS8_STUST|nr:MULTISPECIES: acyl carrier protein [Pseudomonadaceae]MBU1251963.1 acyl carrier protein [Actinomycetota bacterium]MCH2341700.1 acyl carrier protein [Pseudomonas sp.]MBU2316909.1 acyl carrier protein [Actinomycetota bacterium]MDX2353059.1 acyl carrier protein [Stutzerimonas xanthomarina]TYP64399.1 acyl carrier protein [Stutzerimonas stutzeri]|tara:strand:+ start:38 stop:307 length:270 start_codon:yes stop_codon:yes gene_type:complete
MDDTRLKQALKQLLIRECDKQDDIDWQSIEDSEPLFGQQSRVQMDSLDALQVSLALQQHYGVRIEGAKDGRRVLNTIDSIAAFIRQQQP